MGLDQKFSQEYPVNVGVPEDYISGPTLFLLYMNDLPDDVIFNSLTLFLLLKLPPRKLETLFFL